MDNQEKPRIKDVIDQIEGHPFLSVPEETTLREIAHILRQKPDVRGIYVTDRKGHLKGAISLGKLIRNITARRYNKAFGTRRLLRCITCSKARDIMTTNLLKATLDTPIDSVVDSMIESDIKEIPIVDIQGKIIKNAGLLDLWSHL